MGVAILQSPVRVSRPAYFDDLRPYPARDGEVLYQVYKQRKGAAYWVLWVACRVARFIQRIERRLGRDVGEDVTNPNGVEIEGTWDAEAKAIEHCRLIREAEGADVALGYSEIVVNRAYPLRRQPMRGLTDPTRWPFTGKPSHAQARFKLVDVDESKRLNEQAERLIQKCAKYE